MSAARKPLKDGSLPAGAMARPKILLAKPSAAVRADASPGASIRIMREEPPNKPKTSVGSLKLVNENWEHCWDRIQQILSENSDFKVVGVIGSNGAGKSTIMNELYGFSSASTAPYPPFNIQTEENKASARHCTTGIDFRVSSERLILLDTQPILSSSIVIDTMKPDGSSLHNLNFDQSLPADVAHQLMSIQLAVFLFSVCHIVLVVFEESDCSLVSQFLKTAEMLKFELPDPSATILSKLMPFSDQEIHEKKQSHVQNQHEKQTKPKSSDPVPNTDSDSKKIQSDLDNAISADMDCEEYFPDVVFINSKLKDSECNINHIQKTLGFLSSFFSNTPFACQPFLTYCPSPFPLVFPYHSMVKNGMNSNTENFKTRKSLPQGVKDATPTDVASSPKTNSNEIVNTDGVMGAVDNNHHDSGRNGIQSNDMTEENEQERNGVNFWVLPSKKVGEKFSSRIESFDTMISRLRDKVIGVKKKPFSNRITEREWLKNSNIIWERIKKSTAIMEYGQLLLASYSYRR